MQQQKQAKTIWLFLYFFVDYFLNVSKFSYLRYYEESSCIDVNKIICEHLKKGEKQTSSYEKLMERIMPFTTFIEILQDPRKRMVSIFIYYCRSGFYFFLGGMLIWIVDHQKGICLLKLEQSTKYFVSPEIFPKHANSVDVSIRFSKFMVNDKVNDGVEYVLNKLNLN